LSSSNVFFEASGISKRYVCRTWNSYLEKHGIQRRGKRRPIQIPIFWRERFQKCHTNFVLVPSEIVALITKPVVWEVIKGYIGTRKKLWQTYSVPFLFVLYCFCSAGVWTQGFMLTCQVLCCLNHASSSFALVTLEIGSCFLPRPTWTELLLFHASWYSWDDKHMSAHSVFFYWHRASGTFSPGLVWNQNPPISASHIAEITGMGHWCPTSLPSLVRIIEHKSEDCCRPRSEFQQALMKALKASLWTRVLVTPVAGWRTISKENELMNQYRPGGVSREYRAFTELDHLLFNAFISLDNGTMATYQI
jgi:hypothetical protein